MANARYHGRAGSLRLWASMTADPHPLAATTHPPTADPRSPIPDTRHATPGTRHPAPDTRHLTPDRRPPTPAGIYIHLPFCATKCNYCDFVTAPFEEEVARRYLTALLREIRSAELISNLRTADTVYFGGGTPSIVSARFIEEILNALAQRFSIAAGAEISLEMNPSTAESDRTPSYRAMGINRLSIGVQSFEDRELVAMTRAHTAGEARAAVENAARCGFVNVSLDLMLGLPGQTAESFDRSLRTAAALPIRHLSVYMLELHGGTPLHNDVTSRRLQLPSEDFVAEQYRRLVPFLESAGLLQYEISNFAQDGFQSRHNLKYWARQPYIGFGVSSHSFDGKARWKNVRSLPRYLGLTEGGRSPREGRTPVSGEEACREQLFLGLRLRQGVPATIVHGLLQNNSPLQQRWHTFMRQGWVERVDTHYRFTTAGYLVSNAILSELV